MPTTAMTAWVNDAEGREKTMSLAFDSADIPDSATATTVAQGYEALFHAVIGGNINRMVVHLPLTLTGGNVADGGYSVGSGATLSFRDSDGVGKSLWVPTWLDGKFNLWDVADGDADVIALINAITNQTALPPLSTPNSASLWANYLGGQYATRKR